MVADAVVEDAVDVVVDDDMAGKSRMVSPRINPTPTPIPKIVMAAFITAVARLVTIKREYPNKTSRFRSPRRSKSSSRPDVEW